MLPNVNRHFRSVFRHLSVIAPTQGIRIVPSSRHFFEEKYNTEESEKILKVLNETKEENDFRKYIISNKRINELMRLRVEKGGFSHLDDLIPIMGIKVLEKFYGSMLQKRSLGLGNPMLPCLPPEEIEAYTRVLSFNISGNRVSWSLVRKLSGGAVHLDSLEVRAFELVPKAHFLHVLKQMTELGRELPPCDLCVCEEFPSQVPSTFMFSFFVQMTQARSMLLGYLAARPNPPKIVSIKTVAVAKLFNTYIGSEKVSGQHVVDDMFEGATNLEMEPRLRNYYLDSESQNKEHLSNVFLFNLAYWKLTNQISRMDS